MLVRPDDVVAQLRLIVHASTLSQALHQCEPVIDELGVGGVEATPTAPGQYAVKLVLVEPSRDGEASADALRRVMTPLLARMGLDEDFFFELDESGRRTTGAFVNDPEYAARLLPSCDQVVMSVWMADAVEDHDHAIESLEVDEYEQPQLDEEEVAGLMEYLRWSVATHVVLVADVVASDGIDAREQIRSLITGGGHEPLIGEPLPGPDGTIRVEVLVTAAEAGVEETFEDIVEKLALPGFEVVEREPDLVRAVWSAPRPTEGVILMELRVGKGAGFGTDLGLLPEE
ncbi:MAG: hypothetical protein M3O70_15950 [Actinomycetota bacterium]|nr:hypothetical protein [Actinomycetota bacterium]